MEQTLLSAALDLDLDLEVALDLDLDLDLEVDLDVDLGPDIDPDPPGMPHFSHPLREVGFPTFDPPPHEKVLFFLALTHAHPT